MAILAVLVLIDVVLDRESAAITGSFIAPVFIAALISGPWTTMAVALVATAAALASPLWNAGTGDVDWIVRTGLVFVVSGVAVASSWLRVGAWGMTDRLRLLDGVGDVADGSLPLAETLDRVLEALVPSFADICVVDAVHGGRVNRIAARAVGRADAHEVEQWIRRRTPTLPGWLVKIERHWRGIPRWMPKMRDEDVRRLAHDPEDLERLRRLGLRSTVSVPIAARERNLGVLTLITAWSGRSYDSDDVRFAQIVASRVGLALENAGLFSDLESIERRMDSVMSLLDEAVVIHGASGELLFANPAAARMLGFATSEEALAGAPAKLSERISLRDEGGREVDPATLGPRMLGGAEAAAATLRIVDRASGRERWCRAKGRAVPGPGGETLYAVTAIEDVTDVMRAEFTASLLARLGELVSHSADYRLTLKTVPELLVPDFADACAVNLVRDDGVVEQVALAAPDPELAETTRELRTRIPIQIGDGSTLARVIERGEPLLIRGEEELARAISTEPSERRELARAFGVRSGIVAPLRSIDGTGIGALAFVNDEASRIFDEDDLELAAELARRVGLVLEGARLTEERRRVSDALQRELLPPSLPEMPGWEVATMYEPAGELNEVGGDFYEVFPVEDGWAVVLGDVSGKGAVAASITAEARHTLRVAGTLSGDPRTGLRLLDRNLRERADAALCSVAVVVLPKRSGERSEAFVYLAGHPHPLLLSGDEVRPVGVPGPLLGVAAGGSWEPVRIELRRGDQLVLFTDGVIEARGAQGDRFGTERLRDNLGGCREPQAAVERVRAALTAFGADSRDDDAAVVAIRCGGDQATRLLAEARRVASITSAAS